MYFFFTYCLLPIIAVDVVVLVVVDVVVACLFVRVAITTYVYNIYIYITHQSRTFDLLQPSGCKN